MNRVVFMLEEPSMRGVLENIIPGILPVESFLPIYVVHQGKRDLDNSVPRKLRAFNTPDTQFVIIRDLDGEDCTKVKTKLKDLCRRESRPKTIVRLAIMEMEAWFFGDLDAVAEAFSRPELSRLKSKSKYRDPDAIAKPSRELKVLINEYQKISGAKAISEKMHPERNNSKSFQVFWKSMTKMAKSRLV